MRILWDYERRPIRLSEERPIQVLEQAEMSGGGPEIARTVSHPQCVVASSGDPEARSYYRETTSDQIMQKVDDQGRLLGFSVLRVSSARGRPLEVALRLP